MLLNKIDKFFILLIISFIIFSYAFITTKVTVTNFKNCPVIKKSNYNCKDGRFILPDPMPAPIPTTERET